MNFCCFQRKVRFSNRSPLNITLLIIKLGLSPRILYIGKGKKAKSLSRAKWLSLAWGYQRCPKRCPISRARQRRRESILFSAFFLLCIYLVFSQLTLEPTLTLFAFLCGIPIAAFAQRKRGNIFASLDIALPTYFIFEFNTLCFSSRHFYNVSSSFFWSVIRVKWLQGCFVNNLFF